MEKITYASLGSLGEEFHQQFDAALERNRATWGRSYPLFIGGRPRKSKFGTFDDASPSDTRLILGRFQKADRSDVPRATAAARAAFPAWSALGWEKRVALLTKAADLMTERQFDLTASLVMETGKNRFEAIAEVSETIDLILYYARQMQDHNGFEMPMGSETERAKSILKPYGVWTVIAPFNFPLALGTGMAAAALLGGNTVVFKPASDTPLAGIALFEALLEAKVPEGVFNLLTGPGSTVGEELAESPDVDGLVFTGSRNVGMQIMIRFRRSAPKPCITEMGGKNPAIIMPSANLDDATEGVLRSAFGYSGQKCSACSRLYLHKSIYKEFLDLLIEKTEKLKVGNPIERDVFTGPLINARAAKRFERIVRQGRVEGRLICGGGRLRRGPLAFGHFVAPTIFDKIAKDSVLFRDELFAPILTVRNIGSLEEAIYLSNESEYGLTAGIFTQDEHERQGFFDSIAAGVTYCNRRGGATTGAWPGVQSFGGWKLSGSTGKNALGPCYVTQFMREQSQTG